MVILGEGNEEHLLTRRVSQMFPVLTVYRYMVLPVPSGF